MRWTALPWGGLLIFALTTGTSGCAHQLGGAREPTMVRSFHGTLVPGGYVSPSAYQHYILAQLQSNAGRLEESVEELRQAIASDGASAYLRVQLGEQLLALGRIDEAHEECEAAVQLDPHMAEVHVLASRLKKKLGDFAGAEAELRRAIEVEPAVEESYLALIGLYETSGKKSRQLQVWRDLARAVPTSAKAHEALGQAALRSGDRKTALAELERAVEFDGNLREARLDLAKLYRGEGQGEAALRLFREAYERSEEPRILEDWVKVEMSLGHIEAARALVDRIDDGEGGAEQQLLAGWLRLSTKEAGRARALGEALLQKQKGNSGAAHLLCAAALEELGSVDLAVQHLQKVPPSTAQFTAAQLRLGRLLSTRGRYREAAEFLTRALRSIGTGSDGDAVNELLARVHEQAGERDRATSGLEQALRQRPESQSLVLALGQLYHHAGNWPKAVALVRQVLRRQPDSAEALNFVGYLLAQAGKELDEAERLLERAVALRPHSGQIADSLGWLYFKRGRLLDAERLLVRADRLAPEDPEILGHLGQLYLRKDDKARACEVYRRALAHEPDEKVRRSIEEQLLQIESGKIGTR